MQNRVVALAAIVLAFSFTAAAQKPDPDVQKLTAAYEAAFNKGDSKALTTMYTADALRVGPDGRLLAGRKDIEANYVTSFAGPLKGAKLTLTPGRAVSVTPDVKITEGTFTVAGSGAGATPMKGRYVNTIVRQGGQWLLAAVNARPDTPPPAK